MGRLRSLLATTAVGVTNTLAGLLTVIAALSTLRPHHVGAHLRRLKPHQWAWLHFKLSLGIGWTTGILFVTPALIQNSTTESGLRIWTYGTMVGAIVSMIGLLMSAALRPAVKDRGLRVELIGVILFGGGPLQYFILQVTFAFDDFGARYALGWFAYAMLAAVITRGVIIVTSMRTGTVDRTRDNR